MEGAGKDPKDRGTSRKEWDQCPIWCDCFPSKFRDKCDKCKKENKKIKLI